MKNIYAQGISTVAIALISLFLFGMTISYAFAETADDEPIVGTAQISESKALSVAEKAYTGDGKFTDIELEMEKGVLVFAVEYTEKDGNEVDVKIDAKTGAVVVVESDEDEPFDDDEGDDEDDDESTIKMQTLINLLNQLIDLLRQRGS